MERASPWVKFNGILLGLVIKARYSGLFIEVLGSEVLLLLLSCKSMDEVCLLDRRGTSTERKEHGAGQALQEQGTML